MPAGGSIHPCTGEPATRSAAGPRIPVCVSRIETSICWPTGKPVSGSETKRTGQRSAHGCHRRHCAGLVKSHVAAEFQRFAVSQPGGVHLTAHTVKRRSRTLDNRDRARSARNWRCWYRLAQDYFLTALRSRCPADLLLPVGNFPPRRRPMRQLNDYPRGFTPFKSITTPRLLVFRCRNRPLFSECGTSLGKGPMRRDPSPDGDSTLITSAP